ncbi:MAG: phosphotransferase [Mycoplasmatales bacterium]
MNNIHQMLLSKTKPGFKIIEKFKGGMSNHTYLVENTENSEYYVFRIPGNNAHFFVDFNQEYLNLNQIEELDITNDLLFFNPDNGIKISKYIPGFTPVDEVDYPKIVTTLKKIHESGIVFSNDYNHLARLSKYESYHNKESDTYELLKAYWQNIYQVFLKKHIDTPCHGDAQFSNLVKSADTYFLLDWEFSGMNDPIYDIACFGNVDFNFAILLLNYYYPEVTSEHYIRLNGWRMFQCLQWYNVALYKHQIGLGKQLGIEFDIVSDKYLKKATELAEYLQNYINVMESNDEDS